jgi:hypothetical protein
MLVVIGKVIVPNRSPDPGAGVDGCICGGICLCGKTEADAELCDHFGFGTGDLPGALPLTLTALIGTEILCLCASRE